MKSSNKKDLLEHYKNEAERWRYLATSRLSADPVSARVAFKEDQRLYRKVGKKFVPVNDPYAYDGLSNGFWLVRISNGCTSIRQEIFPSKAPIHAAARDLEDKLVKIIREASEARPSKQPLTPAEKKDWDAFIAKHGESFSTLQYPSMQENAEKIIKALIGESR